MIKALRQQHGFTLLELLAVLVVVSIVVVLIVPTITSGPERARDQQRKKDLLTIKSALETYYSSNNTYPGATTWTTDLTKGPTPYLSQIPTDPKTHTNYTYSPIPTGCTTGSCTSYTLSAKLENPKDAQAGQNGVYEVMSAY